MHTKLRRESTFRKSKKKLIVKDENDELGFLSNRWKCDTDSIVKKVREETSLPVEKGPERDYFGEFDADLRKRASCAT